MTLNIIKINGTDLGIKEYHGQRVVTLKDIDTVHERPEGTAKRNFAENKNKFIKNVDYFLLDGDELKDFKQSTDFVLCNTREITLISESGYLMLVKSLQDDLAWAVQRQLVNTYFKTRDKEKNLQYPPKATSVGEIASLMKEWRLALKAQGTPTYKLVELNAMICRQFGIDIPEGLVCKPISFQLTLNGVIE